MPRALRTTLNLVLHVMLLLVLLTELRSIWTGVADKPRYLAVFPGAVGTLYYATLVTSFAAGVNCVFIWLKKRWALWVNAIIGMWSIALIEIVRGPRVNEAIVLVASTVTTVLPLLLWASTRSNPPAAEAAVRTPRQV